MAAKNTKKPAAKDTRSSAKKPVAPAAKAKTTKAAPASAPAHKQAKAPAPVVAKKPEARPVKSTSTAAARNSDIQHNSRTTPAPAAKKPTGKKPSKEIYTPATGTSTSQPMSAKELDKFRSMIQELRMEQSDELDALTEQLREMTSSENNDDNSAYSLHMAEQGTDAMEREKTFLQAQRVSDYIKKLDESLRRIQDATFGLCRVCGLRLGSERLMAVPVTQVCTVYKNTSKPCEPGRLHMDEMGLNEDNNE